MNESLVLFYKYDQLFKRLSETAYRAYKGLPPKYDKYKYTRSLYTKIRDLVESSEVSNTLLDLDDFRQELTISWLKILENRSKPGYKSDTPITKHLLRVSRWNMIKLVADYTRPKLVYPCNESDVFVPEYLKDPEYTFSLDLSFLFYGNKEGPLMGLASTERQMLYRMYAAGWDRWRASKAAAQRALTGWRFVKNFKQALRKAYPRRRDLW